MKFMISKKIALSILLLALIGPTVVFAQVNAKSVGDKSKATLYVEDPSKIIDYIDNNEGRLSLGDTPYRLKLNAKVYDQQKRLVNRYALKEGQRVLIEISKEGAGRYIDSIFILDK
jgi:hypothetical protein